MKKYSAKTLDEAIKIACTDLDINTEDLIYEVEEEKKGLFKKAVISNADGETSRFDKIYGEYKLNRDITKKRIYIETMEEIMKNNEKVIVDEKINGNLIQLLNNK